MFPWPDEATEDEHEHFLSDFLSKKDGADFSVIDYSGWSPIRRAIYLGKAEIVKLLIDNSMVKNLDTPSCSEFTPLTYAVAKNDLEIVETLIASGAKVDQKDDRGQLPLEIAVERGYIEIVKFLKETKNSNLEIPCVSKYTPLKYAKATNDTKIDHLSLEKAISESNSESIKLLIEKSKGIILNVPICSSYTPLTFAIAKNNFEMVELLISAGADVSLEDGKGRLPLELAVEKNNLEMIQFLIEKTKEQSLRHRNNLSAKAEIIKLLNDKSKNLNASYIRKYTPLTYAIAINDFGIVQELIYSGADVNREDDAGWLPLVIAISKGNLEILKLLLRNEANPNMINMKPCTPVEFPLAKAIERNDVEAVEILIEHGADVNFIDLLGRTPITYTFLRENTEILELLIQRGADINIVDNQGTSPITRAVGKNKINIARILITNGANVNLKNGDGFSLLSIAIWKDSFDMVELLVENGATIETHERNGSTPLENAITLKHMKIIKFLQKVGADLQFRTKTFKENAIELTLYGKEISTLKTLTYNQ